MRTSEDDFAVITLGLERAARALRTDAPDKVEVVVDALTLFSGSYADLPRDGAEVAAYVEELYDDAVRGLGEACAGDLGRLDHVIRCLQALERSRRLERSRDAA